MTQAFNLSQFANKLNTSGQTDNTGLQNSSVSVNAGTGLSGGGSVALGGSTTLTNTGVTSIISGTGISISGATGAVTITNTSTGVTSAISGNGIAVSGSTGAVTFSVAAPSVGSVGSYAFLGSTNTTAVSAGNTKAGSNLRYAGVNTGPTNWGSSPNGNIGPAGSATAPSGTWRAMGTDGSNPGSCCNPGYGATVWVRTV